MIEFWNRITLRHNHTFRWEPQDERCTVRLTWVLISKHVNKSRWLLYKSKVLHLARYFQFWSLVYFWKKSKRLPQILYSLVTSKVFITKQICTAFPPRDCSFIISESYLVFMHRASLSIFLSLCIISVLTPLFCPRCLHCPDLIRFRQSIFPKWEWGPYCKKTYFVSSQ